MMEISNIGIDIINIERFKKKEYAKNKKFYQKIFSKSEIEYCLEFKNSSEHFAGKFAIKEAVRKSIKEKIPFNKILTTHKNSKPRIILKTKLNYEFLVSVSHETNMALAIVIALKK
jgi:holo-[acyl-carrier protein] synthase